MGIVSGGLGSFIGTSAEVALVRIRREEGILRLWRGAIPTVTWTMIFNAVHMPTYSQAKQSLTSTDIMRHDFPLHVVVSLIAASVTTAVSLPVDIVKTLY
jgi:solute carrier family 25 oxoglutarate transporter 11